MIGFALIRCGRIGRVHAHNIAVLRFLVAQRTTLDGVDVPLFAGCWAILRHGNVAGIGQALFHARSAARW